MNSGAVGFLTLALLLCLLCLPLVDHLQEFRPFGSTLVVSWEKIVNVFFKGIVVELPPGPNFPGHLRLHLFDVFGCTMRCFERFAGI